MLTGWRYRIIGFAGTVGLVAASVYVANHPVPQTLFTTHVPLFDRLEPRVLEGSSFRWALALSIAFVAGAMLPLYKPQPRRLLDVVVLTQKRVIIAGLGLATLGYFKWSHRLPRQTLVMLVGILVVAIPLWFVWIRHHPSASGGRTIVVGDDLDQIERIAAAVEAPVLGYLCPSIVSTGRGGSEASIAADGGLALEYRDVAEGDWAGRPGSLKRLGGLSRLEDVLLEYDVDTVVLAFSEADRAEFFGALDICHEHGVAAKVHREYADSVLVSAGDVGELVDVDLEPWDPLDHLFKRAFDVVFAASGLLALSPVILAIAAAIKLDDGGSVLYRQDRTAVFGESFPVYKFRSMIENAEAETGATISKEDAGGIDARVTRVGRVLRQTHLDEIPQLWSILVGDMSVVGPRPERPELDTEIQNDGVDWEKRWFVKPGLTGLAQINDVTGHEPAKKLRHDLEYVRRRSFWFDVQIVIRQIWKVLSDAVEFVSDE